MLDKTMIQHYLANESYWAEGIPMSLVEKRINHSLNFGVYTLDKKQVAYARVITDYTSFAYLCDVFVLTEHRKKGLSKMLMKAVLEYPDFKDIRKFLLATLDAHGLYTQFGFTELPHPERYLEKKGPNDYKHLSE